MAGKISDQTDNSALNRDDELVCERAGGNTALQGSFLMLGWTSISSTKFTATPSSTSVLLMSDTSDIEIGYAIAFADGNGHHFGIVTAVTASTSVTIDGGAFDTGSDVTELYFANSSRIKVERLRVGSVSDGTYASGTTTTTLLADYGGYFRWRGEDASLVAVNAVQKTADAATTQAKINVINDDGASVFTTDITLGAAGVWVSNTTVDVDETKNTVSNGDDLEIEVAVAATGGSPDAAGAYLNIDLIFVLQGGY